MMLALGDEHREDRQRKFWALLEAKYKLRTKYKVMVFNISSSLKPSILCVTGYGGRGIGRKKGWRSGWNSVGVRTL